MSAELDILEPDHRSQALTVTPQVTAADLVARLDVIRTAMNQAMEKDVDYGVIPGTGTKPTLLKPGAEKLAALFQLDVQLVNEKTWHDDGHLTVVSHATVYHQPTGIRLGAGEGICTTRESKYAWRQGERVCPKCGKPAIIKGKEEYGGGWLCFRKKGGCGTKYADGDPTIEGQSTERVPNPDLADAYNTADKMASKRARIDAVLAVTSASALFTQDVEDMPSAGAQEATGATETPTEFPASPNATHEAIAAYKAEVEAAGFDWEIALTALKKEGATEDVLARHRSQLMEAIAKMQEKAS